jgi:hypothetical protein
VCDEVGLVDLASSVNMGVVKGRTMRIVLFTMVGYTAANAGSPTLSSVMRMMMMMMMMVMVRHASG